MSNSVNSVNALFYNYKYNDKNNNYETAGFLININITNKYKITDIICKTIFKK